ncbi:hypothetical protein [Catenulispora yoronensis]
MTSFAVFWPAVSFLVRVRFDPGDDHRVVGAGALADEADASQGAQAGSV